MERHERPSQDRFRECCYRVCSRPCQLIIASMRSRISIPPFIWVSRGYCDCAEYRGAEGEGEGDGDNDGCGDDSDSDGDSDGAGDDDGDGDGDSDGGGDDDGDGDGDGDG